MLSHLSFINRDKVVMKLIKQRCKLADQQSNLDHKREFINKASLPPKKNVRNEIYNLFPPRKKWHQIGPEERYNLDSVARNEFRLKRTYQWAKKKGCNEDWYINLCQKADEIVKYAIVRDIGIEPPYVTAIEKKSVDKDRKIICRPICCFPMYDKIVLSLLNSYLTSLFDDYFVECSYAFRKPSKERNQLQHLDAVLNVQNYRKRHLKQSLFVAECDMQKFYDTISHKVIKKCFIRLLQQAKKDGKIGNPDVKFVKRWFFAYVDCFDFLQNVWILNKKPISHPVWKNVKNSKGYNLEIQWIEKNLLDRRLAKKKKGRVGVPQGGSLSGLIANIVMHYIDMEVLNEINEKDILYCRFCDDMILVGVDKEEVTHCFQQYNKAIKKAKLIAHPNKPMEKKCLKDFWKGKTKGPYEWNETGKDVHPWITFVGFDVNWKGNLRIRQSSLKKQMEKQVRIANELILPYKHGKLPRYSKGTIYESLKGRLISTSVGRVTFWNYHNNTNAHSWMSAFSILDKNPWSENQIKSLDKHRQVVLARAKKKLQNIECTNKKKKDNLYENHRDVFTFRGSPFSYYGQCFVHKDG